MKEKRDFKTKKRFPEIRTAASFRSNNKENFRKDSRSFNKGKTDHKSFKNIAKSNSFRTKDKKWLSKSFI